MLIFTYFYMCKTTTQNHLCKTINSITHHHVSILDPHHDLRYLNPTEVPAIVM